MSLPGEIMIQTEIQKNCYWELEEIAEPISSFKGNRFNNWLTNVWRSLVHSLTTQDEPKVWQSRDWLGHSWWNVYLPKTGQTVRLSSQEEVRFWLEGNLRF
jgi:hypothetical protein